jgi:hypothetical protein
LSPKRSSEPNVFNFSDEVTNVGKTIIVGDDEPGCGQVVMGLIGLGFLGICALCGGTAWLASKGSQQTAPPPPVVNAQPVVDIPANNPAGPGAAPQVRNGILLLKAHGAVKAGVQAWVEVDGKRVADWPVGTIEQRLTLAAGQYRVAVYSIYEKVRRTIYEGLVTVVADTTTTIPLG